MKNAVILFNDNDQVLARVARVKFKKEADIDVLITSDFEEALNACKSKNPELIVTEIIIADPQGRSGFDLITAVRGIPYLEKTPIAVLTDLSQPEDKQKAADLGAQFYFVKTEIGINELIKHIQEILSAA